MSAPDPEKLAQLPYGQPQELSSADGKTKVTVTRTQTRGGDIWNVNDAQGKHLYSHNTPEFTAEHLEKDGIDP